MHEKVKSYLDMQNKHTNTRELLYRARVLIAANLCESYLGPHVEELFEPILPNRSIKKSEAIQFVVEKATGNVLGIQYDVKEKEFKVFTPLDVSDEEFSQIEKYHKPYPVPLNPLVLSISAYILYVLGIGFFMAGIIDPSFNWGYILGAISVIDGLIVNVLAIIVKNIRK